MKHNELIEKLSNLKLEEKCLKRSLDVCYKRRSKTFNRLKEISVEIEQIKFKLNLERKIKDENNNTN